MKKLLAVILSVLMLFGALSVGATAALDTSNDLYLKGLQGQSILAFDFNGASFKGVARVYNGSTLDPATGLYVPSFSNDFFYTDRMYYRVPESSDEHLVGDVIPLPDVNPPSGYAFSGWYCYQTYDTYAGSRGFEIPEECEGKIIEFRAVLVKTEPEEDTMGGVMDILVKVFGTIVGLLFYQNDPDPVEAGMDMMKDLLENLF